MFFSGLDTAMAIMGSQQLPWPHTKLDLSKLNQETGGFSVALPTLSTELVSGQALYF